MKIVESAANATLDSHAKSVQEFSKCLRTTNVLVGSGRALEWPLNG